MFIFFSIMVLRWMTKRLSSYELLLNIGSGDDDDSLDPSHLLRLMERTIGSASRERRGLDMKVIRHSVDC